jgi:hypothetical protein
MAGRSDQVSLSSVIVDALKETRMENIQKTMYNTADRPDIKDLTGESWTRALEAIVSSGLRGKHEQDRAAELTAEVVQTSKLLIAQGIAWHVTVATVVARKPE